MSDQPPPRKRVMPPPPGGGDAASTTTPARANPPPPPGAEQHAGPPMEKGRKLTFKDVSAPGFKTREGDKLTVAYPEVTLPLQLKFAMVRVGGALYERTLVEGEDPVQAYEETFHFLKDCTEAAAQEIIATWAETIQKALTGNKPVERQEGVGR